MSIIIKLNQLVTDVRERIHWDRLSQRDQLAAIILTVSIVLLLLYFVIISPLLTWSSKSRVAMKQGHDDFIFIQKNLVKARQLEAMQQQSSVLDPVSVVSHSGRQSSIEFSRIQPVKQGVSLWIDSVSYQRLLAWLLRLHDKDGLNVKQIRLERIEEGMVKAFVRLER